LVDLQHAGLTPERMWRCIMTANSGSSATVSAELADCIQGLRSALCDHVRLLDALIAVLVNHESAKLLRSEDVSVPTTVASVLAPMVQAAGSSSNTLILLSEASGLHTRDCFSIARSMIEVAVNICFIIAEGEPAAARAERHARQKSYRDLKRESVVGDSIIRLVYGGASDPSLIEGMQEDLDEFTARSGGEKSSIDLSVDDRIARIGEHLGSPVVMLLHWARFAVYRHASEILHGTLFGALFFFGQTTPNRPESLREFTESVAQQHMMILFACLLALSAVVQSFHIAYGFARIQGESKRLVNGLGQLEYFQRRSAK
jgi:hypothetical protein